MRPLTVGVLGNLDYARELGKKSTESDIQLASFKEGETLVSMVLPLRYPEKPAALAYTVNSADAGLLVVDALTKEVGESILAADAAGLSQGLIVLRNFLQPEQLAPVLKNTALEKWAITTDDKQATVRAKVAEFQAQARDGPLRVPVDHHFDVKGIGSVVLGFVKQGTCKKHESYRVYPTKKVAQVRSIQVHDVDVEQAGLGDHVGLALKGITNDEVDRGHVLAPDGTLEARAEKDTIKLRLTCTKFFKAGVNPDMVLTLALGMQFTPVRVKYGQVVPGASGSIDALLQKPLAFEKGQRGVLFSLDAQAQRVVGPVVVEG
jgi:selenocysteine-specific translation elongation factor